MASAQPATSKANCDNWVGKKQKSIKIIKEKERV